MTLNANPPCLGRRFQDGAIAVIISYIQKLFIAEIGNRLLVHNLDKGAFSPTDFLPLDLLK